MEPIETFAPEILNELPYGVALVSPGGQIAWRNPRFDLLAAPEVRPAPASVDRIPGWTDDPGLRAIIASEPSPDQSYRARLARSGRRPVSSASQLDIYVRNGPVGKWLLTVVPIQGTTDEEQGRLFYEAFLTSSNAMEITDPSGILIDVNPAFEQIYGYSRAECIGRKPNLVRSRRSRPEIYERMWADLLNPAIGHWSGEIMNRDRRGQERPVLLTITAVKNDQNETTHYVGVAVDLSERRRWEQSAAHGDRLASIGQLAAGVAHEINTPLANVMLVAESIRRRASDPWIRARIETITAQVESADRIVRGLLDFARRSEPNFSSLDLVHVTRDAVEFVRGKQSADVEIDTRYAPGPWPIRGDRGQLIQVLTNLLNNAYEAIDGPGRILVEVRGDGNEAVVEVTDSGPGISASALPHIFEPFFTTKPEGKGTGLGLAICHGILQSHQGTITVANVPDSGARFTVRLPLVREEAHP